MRGYAVCWNLAGLVLSLFLVAATDNMLWFILTGINFVALVELILKGPPKIPEVLREEFSKVTTLDDLIIEGKVTITYAEELPEPAPAPEYEDLDTRLAKAQAATEAALDRARESLDRLS